MVVINGMNNSNGSSMSKLEQLARKRAYQRQQQQQQNNNSNNQVNESTITEQKLSLRDKLAALKDKKKHESNTQSTTKGSTLLQSLKNKNISLNGIRNTNDTNDSISVIERQTTLLKNELNLSSRLQRETVDNPVTMTNKHNKFLKLTDLTTSESSLSSKLDQFRKRKQQNKLENSLSSFSNKQIITTDQSNDGTENNGDDSRPENSQSNSLINLEWKRFSDLKNKYCRSDFLNQFSTADKGQFINFIQKKNDMTKVHRLSIIQTLKRKNDDIYSIFEPLDYTERKRYRKNFMELSPDDVILEAQSKVFDDMSNKISNLSITGNKNRRNDNNGKALQLPSKSRTLIDIDQYMLSKSNHLNCSIVGHHLSGKSTLLGRILMDLNIVDIETIRKLKNLCERNKVENKYTYLTWLSDILPSERSIGSSEMIHKREFQIKDFGKFTFYDNPSKQNITSELITQIFNNDIVIMVVDCSPDGFERGFNLNGQTIEFSILAKLCGIRHMIVVLNKMDTVDWYQGRFIEIVNELKIFYNTLGFKQEDISWIPISSVSGEGIVIRNTSLDWYQGPSLIELLKKKIKEFSEERHKFYQCKYDNSLSFDNAGVSIEMLRSDKDGFFSLAIKDIDISKNEITGWVINGYIQAGESIRVYPLSKSFLIDEIENDTDDKQIGVPGSFVKMRLLSSESRNEKGLLDNIEIGDFVTSLLSPVTLVNSTTVKLELITTLMELTRGMKLIINRQIYTNTVKILKLNKANSRSKMVIECELARQDTMPYFTQGNGRENIIIMRVLKTNKIIGLAKLIT